MYMLPSFYVGDDEKKLEKEIRRIKRERGIYRQEIKHYYYGLPIVAAPEIIEDVDISTSCVFERGCSGALPHVEAKLREVRGGAPTEEDIKAEKRAERTYGALCRLTYDETEKNGGDFTYVADLYGPPVTVYRIVRKSSPGYDAEGYLWQGDKEEFGEVTDPLKEDLFYDMLRESDMACLGLDEASRKECRAEAGEKLRELVPCKLYTPRDCDISAAEKEGRTGLSDVDMFVDALRRIGIDEWKSRYEGENRRWGNPDGSWCENHCPTWKLTLEYSDGKRPLVFKGYGDCPFNLHLLTRLLDGLEDSEFIDYDYDYFWLVDEK